MTKTISDQTPYFASDKLPITMPCLTKGTFVHSVKLTILYKQAIQKRCKLSTFWQKWLPAIVFCISHKRSAHFSTQ